MFFNTANLSLRRDSYFFTKKKRKNGKSWRNHFDS